MADLIAHLSDPHLDGGTESRQRFERAVGYLRSMTAPLAAIVLTGDIIEAGAVGEYARVAAALDGIAPTLYCPGNSDRRGPFRAALLPHHAAPIDADAQLRYARTLGRLTFLMLDSSLPGHYHGALDAASLAWLRAKLAGLPSDHATLLCLHHPMVELGHAPIDRLRLQNAEPLADVVRASSQIVAILVGHTHAATATTFAGRPLLVAPGIHSGLHLPWEAVPEGSPLINLAAPPGLAIHRLDDERRIATYYQTLD